MITDKALVLQSPLLSSLFRSGVLVCNLHVPYPCMFACTATKASDPRIDRPQCTSTLPKKGTTLAAFWERENSCRWATGWWQWHAQSNGDYGSFLVPWLTISTGDRYTKEMICRSIFFLNLGTDRMKSYPASEKAARYCNFWSIFIRNIFLGINGSWDYQLFLKMTMIFRDGW